LARQTPAKSFREILLEVIDEALASLGENVKTSVYFHLEKTYKIRKQDIPSKIDDFSCALEQIFGLGARFLEIMFMKGLYLKIGASPQKSKITLNSKETTFPEYVCLMKKVHEDNQKEQKELLMHEEKNR